MENEKKENLQKYKKILKIVNNSSDILDTQQKLEDYADFLRRMVIIFENFINKNLQVEIKIRKFIMEEFYGR